MIKIFPFLLIIPLIAMNISSEISWYNNDTWNNNNLSFFTDRKVMYFNSNSESEIATAFVEIPDGYKSFGFSVEIGNVSPLSKPGCNDSARVEIGFTDESYNTTYQISTGFISDNDYYKIYSIGESDAFFDIPGNSKYVYVTCEGHNAENNAIDAFFRNFNLDLSKDEGEQKLFKDLVFSVKNTTDAVRETGDIVLRNICLIAFIILVVVILCIREVYIKRKKLSIDMKK